ncbi:MAG TPA: prepilin peptidase [Candidatus Dormibacteraeota bacterium]|jgi:leader peptidase (prepilin peptidase)/N-methyltransferase|nr:prepilin peptidase [Candidatus Dormibacteraeota bacterium]
MSTTILPLLGAAAGAALASFAGVVHARGWRRACAGRSQCDSCAHALGWAELVPLLGWLALRGRCRHCGADIGVTAPLTELLGAAAGVAVTLVLLLRVG